MIIHVLVFFLCASLGTEHRVGTISVVMDDLAKRYNDELAVFRSGLHVYDVNGQPIEITRARAQSSKWEGEITFKLYTKQTPTGGQQLKTNDTTSLQKSGFNPSKPTYMITHGWRNNENSPSCVLIRDAYLENTDSNVIVVDWSVYSMSIHYIDVSYKVKGVGETVKRFIKWLYANGLNADNLTLVGHSLGAHVMGLAGYKLMPKVNNIVGLDPALPMFYYADNDEAISREDAKHVQIIHTNAGFLGYACAHGHSDFYPNGGSEQPGCCKHSTVVCTACSHSRAVEYFAESISKNFNGTECDTYAHFQRNSCADDAQIERMGGLTLESARNGEYYVRTNSTKPFSEVRAPDDISSLHIEDRLLRHVFGLDNLSDLFRVPAFVQRACNFLYE